MEVIVIHADTGSSGYVTSHTDYDGRNGRLIDLGLATSPIGPASELDEPLRQRSPLEALSRYPSDPLHTGTRQLLIDGIGLRGITPTSLVFSDNGSYGAGDEIIRYMAMTGKTRVITPLYSFPNVSQWAIRHGIKYQPLETTDLDPRSSIAKVLEMGDELSTALVYIDYPNNPYGGANPALLRDIVDHVSLRGGTILVDLAFGEVLGDEFRDAIQYTIDRGGIALGSLSKTQGLPGLRTGYAILSPEFSNNGYSGDQRLVFGLNNEAEFVYQQLFQKRDGNQTLAQIHAARVTERNCQVNRILATRLEQLGLQIGPTDIRTPIQVVVSDLPDLYQRLALEGILTESLHDYRVTLGNIEGYGHSAVRMLTPKISDIEEVIRRIGLALR